MIREDKVASTLWGDIPLCYPCWDNLANKEVDKLNAEEVVEIG